MPPSRSLSRWRRRAITRAKAKVVVFLPGPLLSPTMQALEDPETAEGIGFMVGLEEYARGGGEPMAFELPEKPARLTLLRR